MIDIKIEKYFYVLREKNNFAYLSKFDLILEIKNGTLFVNSFVFHEDGHEWLLLETHPDIPDEAKAIAKFSGDIVKPPTFLPISLDEYKEFINSKSELSIVEQEKIVHEVSAVDEFGGLKNYFDQKFNDSSEKEEQILSLVKCLKKEFLELNTKDSTIVDFQEKIEKLNLKLKGALVENDHLKTCLKKSLTKVDILQNRINEDRPKPKNQDQIHDKQVITTAKVTPLIIKPVVEVQEFVDLADLKKGKSFEFENSPVWYLLINGETRGPLRFDELLVYKKDGLIKDCKAKKKSDFSWLDPADVLELNCEVSVKYEDETNPEKNIYLAERGEYRADVRETINFTIGEKDYKGYLTNISLTGGFVEVVKLEADDHAPNRIATLFFTEGFVSEAIDCEVKIRRISENRPKGFGFTFVNAPEKNVEIIANLISSIINHNSKAA